jgi:hypothetical protein
MDTLATDYSPVICLKGIAGEFFEIGIRITFFQIDYLSAIVIFNSALNLAAENRRGAEKTINAPKSKSDYY